MKQFRGIFLISLFWAVSIAWANVPYQLEGLLSVQKEAVTLNTEDGRIFQLDMDSRKARELDGEMVSLTGVARQCDELEILKVKTIARIDAAAEKIVLPPFKSYQRPTRMLSNTGEVIVMSDVRWGFKGKAADGESAFNWETVTIRPSMVEAAYFIKKPFPPEKLAGHSLLLFTFKNGGLVDSRGGSARGLVLTIEAYQRLGQKYSIKKGLKTTFNIVWMLTSWEDYSSFTCDINKDRLIIYPLRFDHSRLVSLVKESIREAAVNRSGEYYHTVTNNCTNNLVVLFNRVLDKKIRMWWISGVLYNLRATMPAWVPNFLIKKGILEKPLPEMNEKNYFAGVEKLGK